MKRRDFVKAAAATGAYAAVSLRPSVAFGQSAMPRILWVNFQAPGGWDQTLFCDPKPALRGPYLPAGTYPGATSVANAGNIPYLKYADLNMNGPGFFTKYYGRLAVFNGIDTTTNNHDVGSRYCASGSLNNGMPCFSAQVAAVAASGGLPLGFIDLGGYAETASLVTAARLGEYGAMTNLQAVINYNDSHALGTYTDATTLGKIEAAHKARLQRLAANNHLPTVKAAIDRMLSSRNSQARLQNVTIPPVPGSPPPGLNADVLQVIEFAFNAFATNLSVSLNFATGYFDTHSNNEEDQLVALTSLFTYAGYIIDKADSSGVKMIMVINSDFGRTPAREGSGTGHYPIASMMIAQSAAVLGTVNLPVNTVIGATDANLLPLKIDKTSLQISSGGITLTPGHIYNGLRRIAGIAESSQLTPFPISLPQEINLG